MGTDLRRQLAETQGQPSQIYFLSIYRFRKESAVAETAAEFANSWPNPGAVEELKTLHGSVFSVEFLANDTIRIKYGKKQRKLISRDILQRVADAHTGKLIPASGAGSVDEFLSDKASPGFFCRTHLQSYVCPLLVRLGYAQKVGERFRFL
jgi:hypothetical protein